MRRARIIATANIPVRRKFQLENAKKLEQSANDENKKNDDKGVDKDPVNEEIIKQSESTNIQIIDEQVKNTTEKEKTCDSQKAEPVITFVNLDPSVPAEAKKPKVIENVEVKPPTSTTEISSSPSKAITSRVCFMRPVPRLDGHGRIRRNSIQGSGASASESEDDTRRNTNSTNHLKTSDNSSQNGVDNETNSNNINNNVSNNSSGANSKIIMKQKRKMVISESTRKLAEARREFQLKHENKQPDRTKLTMYDLIYYNPASNPMKKTGDSPINNTVPETNTDEQTEEEVDDPTETAMPVPQVKVGPDGQLIIDEQSLVIERTGVKKNREALAKRQAIVDDDGSFGGGFYKKRKRVKEWPKWETIKFYKALSTIGTDFLLMQSLFTNRSRQEIKMKFKKEEKLNRKLVEKALSSKLDFDVDTLKQDLETFEKFEESLEKSPPVIEEKVIKRRRLFRRMAVTSLGDAGKPSETDEKIEKEVKKLPRKRKNFSKEKVSKTSKMSVLSSGESDCDACDDTDSDSGTEVYRPRPTRSGRTPKSKTKNRAKQILDSVFKDNKPKKKIMKESTTNNASVELFETNESQSIETENDQAMIIESIGTSVPDISSVEPGSLVIVSNESAEEPGKTVVQVYMVESNIEEIGNTFSKTLNPVNEIESELIPTVTEELTTTSTLDNYEK
ncbi:transcription factor TFIIIB component B'' homolog [Chelonus insularis]|uniref:transcription factor TFIIIB component B'' homolog n=1 Tax=Chelonus insularis TaxID=460826 RepID=UPI00158BC1B5|nr:transcription factor TFIIIB component B'' homolog [Chelonus insularis]